MRTKRIALLFFCVLFYSLAASTIGSAEDEDLIPPTRTLDQAEKPPMGKITVVSDPPGLKVFLNGSEIGRTPIWLKEIEAGTHHLRIQDSETKILAMPEKFLQISLFEGEFIIREVKPEKEAELEKEQQKTEEPPPSVSECRYGYYQSSSGEYKCFYGGWGVHTCRTGMTTSAEIYTGLRECRVSGKAHSCEQLERQLRARDCCRSKYGGFSKSFSLESCGTR